MSEKDSTPGSTLEQARAAKSEALGAFKRVARVVGVGITRIGRGYGLKVNLQRMPDTKACLPKEINGVPIRVEVVGKIKKRFVCNSVANPDAALR
jgi:hypothetical protein